MATGKGTAHDANALFRTGEFGLARGRGVPTLAICIVYSATPSPIRVHSVHGTLAVAPILCSARTLVAVRYHSFSLCFSVVYDAVGGRGRIKSKSHTR